MKRGCCAQASRDERRSEEAAWNAGVARRQLLAVTQIALAILQIGFVFIWITAVETVGIKQGGAENDTVFIALLGALAPFALMCAIASLQQVNLFYDARSRKLRAQPRYRMKVAVRAQRWMDPADPRAHLWSTLETEYVTKVYRRHVRSGSTQGVSSAERAVPRGLTGTGRRLCTRAWTR
jgi:hypothetical protein